RTLDFHIHHFTNAPGGSRSLRRRLWLLERTQLVLTLETERLLRTRGPHRSAIVAKSLRECTASDSVLSGRIVPIRPRHLAADGLLTRLWHSRPRTWALLLL